MKCQASPIPRGEKRRDRISAVAEGVFLERGYAETTMQLIAERAGASKETLYRHFGCKEALFSEVVRRRSAIMMGGEEGELSGPPRQVLFDLALSILHFLGGADLICLYRVVVAESPREPELGRIFYAQGPGRVIARLSDYLTQAAGRGELRVGDPDLAANSLSEPSSRITTYYASSSRPHSRRRRCSPTRRRPSTCSWRAMAREAANLADDDRMEEGRPVRAAHKRALDIGGAAGPCDEIDVARGRRAPFGVGVIFKMRQDFRAIDDADMVQRQKREQGWQLRA